MAPTLTRARARARRSSAPAMPGRTIAELAASRACEPDEAALDLLAAEDARVNLVAFARSEDDLRAALTHQAVCIGSDGLAVDPEGPSCAASRTRAGTERIPAC